MELIKTPASTGDPLGREMTPMEILWSRFKVWCYRNISRRIPRLVWIGDEVDVRVRFEQDPLNENDPFDGLFSGGLYEIQKQLLHMGVGFDSGQGCGGRDWEWDFSLRGPISVTFRARGREPQKRTLEQKPQMKLVS